MRPERKDAKQKRPEQVVLLATSSDELIAGEESLLPPRIRIDEKREVQRSTAAKPLRWTPHGNFAELMLFKVNGRSTLTLFLLIHRLLYLGYPTNQILYNFVQAFVTCNDLLPYCSEKTAKDAVETVDVAGGRNETRIDCVKRLIREQYVIM